MEQEQVQHLHDFVHAICHETAKEEGINCSKNFINGLTEVLLEFIKTASKDLEAFSKHAKRSVVSIDDIKLLVRHNPTLQSFLNDQVQKISEQKKKQQK